MRKTVCLIGRPNTGKSSLFNRLVNEKRAIVADTPGVTRDRLYGVVNYKDKSFNLIDTGGIDLEIKDFNKYNNFYTGGTVSRIYFDAPRATVEAGSGYAYKFVNNNFNAIFSFFTTLL